MKIKYTLLGLFLVLTACGGATDPPAAARTPIDGVTMFRGALFGDGVFAEMVPLIRDNVLLSDRVHNPNRLAEMRGFQDRIIARIQADAPDFFGRFQAALRSGRPLEVERAIGEGRIAILNVLASEPDTREHLQHIVAAPVRFLASPGGMTADRAELVGEKLRQVLDSTKLKSQGTTSSDLKYSASDPDLWGETLWYDSWVVVADEVSVAVDVFIVVNIYVLVNNTIEEGDMRASPHSLLREQIVQGIAEAAAS